MNASDRQSWRMPLAWTLLITIDIFLVALAYAQEEPAEEPKAAPVVTQVEGPTDIETDSLRFEAVDLIVDSGSQPLAAYQCELMCNTPGVEFVGIEGGEHKAFANPPYYDPKAMNNNRVILGAFSTDDLLPIGSNRIARVHVQLQGPGEKEYESRLTISATTDGQPIPAVLSVSRAVPNGTNQNDVRSNSVQNTGRTADEITPKDNPMPPRANSTTEAENR